MKKPILRATGITIAFAIAGVASFFLVAPDNHFVWPDLLFYAVLTINSFYSVRVFSRFQPNTRTQVVIDAVLVLSYLALALSVGRPWAFPFFALCLFAIAPVKYALMLGVVPYTKFVKRKIIIDLLGTVLCAAVLFTVVLLDYPFAGAWTLATIFTLSNIFLLLIRPMYRLEDRSVS